jgi:hypothetical protein
MYHEPLPKSLTDPREGIEWPRGSFKGNDAYKQWVREIEEFVGHPICGAKAGSKEDPPRPHPCANMPMRGRKKCSKHGGKTPRGPASPHWKHGGYSSMLEDLPEELREAAEVYVNDENLLELRGEIAVLRSRNRQLYRQLSAGAPAWKGMVEKLNDLRLAMATGANASIPGIMGEMDELVRKGAGESSIWAEIRKNKEMIRRSVDSERKRLEALRVYMEPGKVTALVMSLTEMLRRRLRGHPQILSELVEDIFNASGIAGTMPALQQRKIIATPRAEIQQGPPPPIEEEDDDEP